MQSIARVAVNKRHAWPKGTLPSVPALQVLPSLGDSQVPAQMAEVSRAQHQDVTAAGCNR